MTPNDFIKIFIFFASLGTVISNGVLMYQEKDQLNFNKLSRNQDFYVGILIYTEIFIGLIVLYNILYYVYNLLHKCCNDNDLSSSFSLLKTIYIMSGVASHIILIYFLIKNKNYIDDSIQNINIIFTANFLISIFTIIVVNIYKKCKNDDENERLIK